MVDAPPASDAPGRGPSPPVPAGRLPGWAPLALVAALVAVRVVAIAVLLRTGVADEHSVLGGDARRYAEILTTPGTPYRDFPVEYPPVALGLAAAVHRADLTTTLLLLGISQLALELGTAGVLAWAWNRRAAVVYLILGTPMALFPFPYVRIDLLPVFLTVLAMALLRRRRAAASGVLLAVAVFAKVWPLAVAPLLVVRRSWRGVAAWAVTGALGLVAWIAWAGADGIRQVTTFRGADGWQIESLPGIFLHIADPGASTVEQGAWRTGAAVPGWAPPLLAAGAVAVAALGWWWAARARPESVVAATEAYAPLVAVLALLLFAPIISPQYVLWFVPFAALAAAWGDRVVGGLALAVTALTTFMLASIHAQTEGARWATYPIVVRNALLVALIAVALHRLAAGRSADSRRPAPAGARSAALP